MAEENNNQNNESSDFSVEVVTAGVKPMSGRGGARVRISVAGLYKGIVKAIKTITSKEKQEPWIVFDCEITDTPKGAEEFKGVLQPVLLPGSDNDKNFARKWKTAALNVAKDPANLEKPNNKIRLGPKQFLEKTMLIYIQPAPAGEKNKDGYPRDPFANFCTPGEAQDLLNEAAKLAGAAPAGASATGAQTAAPNGTAAAPSAASGAFSDI